MNDEVSTITQENNTDDRPALEGTIESTDSVGEDAEETEEQKKKNKLLGDPNVQAFLTYYYDKTEKETFGNRTKSYIKAYGLDPVKQYHSAGTLSSRLLKKVGKTASEIMEDSGFGLPALITVNASKAVSTDNPRYLDMLYEIGGYKQVPGTIAQQNNQFNIMNVKADDANDFKNKFKSFLDSL